jgi:hypothetical protein
MIRRNFLLSSLAAALPAQNPGERPARSPLAEVLHPLARIPVSWIIDDSTCLVNLNHFAIPQFRAAWDNTQYHHDWRAMPREIPDSFVRNFGEWCAENGVKGKYSIVPYPACVGRLDRELPGWTREELQSSIRLVRDLMTPNWDIHPEMVTHTRVIDLKTGQPYEQRTPEFMENWKWCGGRSADEIAAYVAYALRILHNIGLPCEGVTSPGGFGGDNQENYSLAILHALRDVYRAEIPHYFLHAFDEGPRSVAPRVENVSGLDTNDPRCVVSIVACTGDWTGSWDCVPQPEPDKYISPDYQRGRVPEIIARNEPVCLLSHWTGFHYNGSELGFRAFQTVVRRINAAYGKRVRWMKLSEIARYAAARELTRIEVTAAGVQFHAPFACPGFTVRVKSPHLPAALREVPSRDSLAPGTWTREGDFAILCANLSKGASVWEWAR